MVSYLLASLWGIVIFASLIGWGGVLNRLLFPGEETDWGQKAGWGLALSVVVGGFLNVTWAISRGTILSYLGVGFACWAIQGSVVVRGSARFLFATLRRHRTQKPVFLLVATAVICLGLVRYAGSVSTLPLWAGFNADDFGAYFVFPEKMLQTGSLGQDPFCERRIASSLGGKSFLDTFVLSMFSEQYLRILDSGLGLLIVLGLLVGRFREVGLNPTVGASVLLLALLVPAPTANITSLLTGSSLFICLFRTLYWNDPPRGKLVSRALIIAVVAGAIFSLKSTFIAPCLIFLGCASLFYVASSKVRRSAIAEVTITLALMVILLLPWMISMHESSGTFLYPLLGKGYNGFGHSAYASMPGLSVLSPHRSLLLLRDAIDSSSLALVALGLCYLRSRQWCTNSRKAGLSLFFSIIVGKILVTFLLQGWWVYRLTFAFVFAGILVLLTEILSDGSAVQLDREWRRVWGMPTAALAAGLLVGTNWADSQRMYSELVSQVTSALRGESLISRRDRVQYSRMQESLPAGQTVLARLDKSCLLDFRRNRIFIVDTPGPGLPPGLPLFKGSEPLAQYLVSHSIRYVAYSYGGETEFTGGLARVFLPGQPTQMRAEGEQTLDFLHSLDELAKTRKRIYNDQDNFVLDLLQLRP